MTRRSSNSKEYVCSECSKVGHNRASCPIVYLSILPVGTKLECSTVIGAEPRCIHLRCDCGAGHTRSWQHISRYERYGYRITCGRCGVRRARGDGDKGTAAKFALVRELIAGDALLQDPEKALSRLRWIFKVESPEKPDPRQQQLFVTE